MNDLLHDEIVALLHLVLEHLGGSGSLYCYDCGTSGEHADLIKRLEAVFARMDEMSHTPE